MILLHALVLRLAWPQTLAGRPDFSILYTAGLILRRGQGHNLYDNHLQWYTQREFASVRQNAGPLPYNHAPFEAILYVPLTYLSFFRAYLLWNGLNILLLIGILKFLQPAIPHVFATFGLVTFLAAPGFYPIGYALIQGQDSILLLALYAFAYVALRDGNDFWAGALLGLGLFKFHLILPFIFILFLRRQFKAVTGFAVSAAVMGCLSLGLIGWKELLYYPRYAWEINRHPPIPVITPESMANLRGLITAWHWSPLALPWLNPIVFVASLLILCWAALQWDPADKRSDNAWIAGFSLALFATFLVSFHGYNQDMSILFLPALLLFEELLADRVDSRFRRALELCLGLLFLSPLYILLTIHWGRQNLFALVLLGTTVTLAGWIKQERRTAALVG